MFHLLIGKFLFLQKKIKFTFTPQRGPEQKISSLDEVNLRDCFELHGMFQPKELLKRREIYDRNTCRVASGRTSVSVLPSP
jgi:hypothetical protein